MSEFDTDQFDDVDMQRQPAQTEYDLRSENAPKFNLEDFVKYVIKNEPMDRAWADPDTVPKQHNNVDTLNLAMALIGGRSGGRAFGRSTFTRTGSDGKEYRYNPQERRWLPLKEYSSRSSSDIAQATNTRMQDLAMIEKSRPIVKDVTPLTADEVITQTLQETANKSSASLRGELLAVKAPEFGSRHQRRLEQYQTNPDARLRDLEYQRQRYKNEMEAIKQENTSDIPGWQVRRLGLHEDMTPVERQSKIDQYNADKRIRSQKQLNKMTEDEFLSYQTKRRERMKSWRKQRGE